MKEVMKHIQPITQVKMEKSGSFLLLHGRRPEFESDSSLHEELRAERVSDTNEWIHRQERINNDELGLKQIVEEILNKEKKKNTGMPPDDLFGEIKTPDSVKRIKELIVRNKGGLKSCAVYVSLYHHPRTSQVRFFIRGLPERTEEVNQLHSTWSKKAEESPSGIWARLTKWINPFSR